MSEMTLAALEDQLWRYIETNPEPKFAFIGSQQIVLDAFLRVAALSHPYFGRAKLCVISSESPQFANQFEKMALAQSLGLISLETYDSLDKLVEEAIVLHASSTTNFTGASEVIKLLPTDCDGESLLINESDPYRYIYACLNGYGSPLRELRIPSKPAEGELIRDWRYLGPSRDFESYRIIEDELRLGLKKNDGSLCPKSSHLLILRSLRGEDVSGEDLYQAIKSCYSYPCLLRDLASYQHDTWILRTLAFHENAESKQSLLVPYPMLLANELPKLEGLSLEESFKRDILYSDFLVPLYFLKTLLH